MSQASDNNKRIAKNTTASLLPNASNNGWTLFCLQAEVLYKSGVTDCGICNAVG